MASVDSSRVSKVFIVSGLVPGDVEWSFHSDLASALSRADVLLDQNELSHAIVLEAYKVLPPA